MPEISAPKLNDANYSVTVEDEPGQVMEIHGTPEEIATFLRIKRLRSWAAEGLITDDEWLDEINKYRASLGLPDRPL